MKILTSEQVRLADAYTISNESIKSIELMERASETFVEAFQKLSIGNELVTVICGPGNNGGDGLAIARLLKQSGRSVEVWLVGMGAKLSEDCEINLTRWQAFGKVIKIEHSSQLTDLESSEVVIDALFGSGISRGITGLPADVIDYVNGTDSLVIAVDMPSGLFADDPYLGGSIMESDYTLSFQTPKLAFFLPQNQQFAGDWKVLDIGLDQQFIDNQPCKRYLIDQPLIKKFKKTYNKFAHKGNFGHALLVAGSKGKMGAAVLSARAALRGGLGLLTVHSPSCGIQIIQATVPEAMCQVDNNELICTQVSVSENITTIGVGPGIGVEKETVKGFKLLLETTDTPMVIDADGLNIISQRRECLQVLPSNSILTPHPKEFQRLAGKTKDDYHRLQVQQEFAKKFQVILIYKGAHTTIALPSGELYFNNTGNPGMATAGSGDVLTGLIIGLLTRTKDPILAAILGVYIHGLAGDLAAEANSKVSMTSGDIEQYIGPAIKNTNLQL